MYIHLNDSLQLASKLTLKRLKNVVEVYGSYRSSKRTGEPHIRGLPISLSIEPTTACNLRCPECPSGLRAFTRPTGKMDPGLLYSLVDQLHETLLYLIFYFQGEPYLHPELAEMIRFASKRKIYTATSTNAHFLTEEAAFDTVNSGLDRMIISIDGSTQQTYGAYRKTGQLDKVLEGTKNILKTRKVLKSRTPHVIWQFLVVGPNEHQIPEVKKLARAYGVDQVVFKTAQIYDYQNGHELIPAQEKYSRYRKRDDGRYELKNKMLNECWKMWHSCVITWDGRVVPCCFDKDAHHVLGDVRETSFAEIWRAQSYDNLRRTLLNARTSIEMCRNCTEGTKVWA